LKQMSKGKNKVEINSIEINIKRYIER